MARPGLCSMRSPPSMRMGRVQRGVDCAAVSGVGLQQKLPFLLKTYTPTNWTMMENMGLFIPPEPAAEQVFLRAFCFGSDRTFLASGSREGIELTGGNGDSVRPSISDSGRIVFRSAATDLEAVPDVGNTEDILGVEFVDLIPLIECFPCQELIGPLGNPNVRMVVREINDTREPMLSTDGGRVVFAGGNQVSVREIIDLDTLGPILRVSESTSCAVADNVSQNPDIAHFSFDTVSVVYESTATNLLGVGNDPTPGVLDVYQTKTHGQFERGDANFDGDINLSDTTFLMAFLFQGGTDPQCLDAGDANDSSSVDLSDAIYILAFAFQGGSVVLAEDVEPTSPRAVQAKYPDHIWHVDLSVVPTTLGFWVPWLPFSKPLRWPFCWWIAVVIDQFSRRVNGFAIFTKEPSSAEVCQFFDRVGAGTGARPKHVITDKGPQFFCYRLKAWCRDQGVRPRFGAIGKKGRIAIVERFFRSLKAECTRLMLVPLGLDPMREEVACYARWDNLHRPHQALGGLTPAEAHAEKTRSAVSFETRPHWPTHLDEERERVRRLHLVVKFMAARRQLPVVELKRAA